MFEWADKSPLNFCIRLFTNNMASKHTVYETKTEELLGDIVQRYEVEIYDVEYLKEGQDYYLRVYIDKPGGVTIDDCENVSRALSDVLDEQDFIPDAYILEVSSPGLGRALTRDRHLEKSIGQEVDIRLYKPLDVDTLKDGAADKLSALTGLKELSGILTGFDKDSINVEISTDPDNPEAEGYVLDIDRKLIAQIRLAFDF